MATAPFEGRKVDRNRFLHYYLRYDPGSADDSGVTARSSQKVKDTMFTLDLARAHIRDLRLDESRREDRREARRARRATRNV
jgi:hypothetical protein